YAGFGRSVAGRRRLVVVAEKKCSPVCWEQGARLIFASPLTTTTFFSFQNQRYPPSGFLPNQILKLNLCTKPE
ncbi:MAG: hypothetical protein ABIO24_00745, partial [Saprospiraceae bacterium]